MAECNVDQMDQLRILKLGRDTSLSEAPGVSSRTISSDIPLSKRSNSKKLAILMVGLPARGKTYLSTRLARYLNWIGYKAATFNIGTYRRSLVGSKGLNHDFFDPSNAEGVQLRAKCAEAALQDMIQFFEDGGQAAVYDGTNSTEERRRAVIDFLKKNAGELQVETVWVESICSDESIVEVNIRNTKLESPDYEGLGAEQALADFTARIKQYEKSYETLPSNSEDSYIKIINAGTQVIANRIQGFLMSKICSFLLNVSINHAPIFLSRHGESEYNVKGWVGGDSNLTERGHQYAEELANFIHGRDELKDASTGILNLHVWCSTLKRTIQTAEHLRLPYIQWQALREIQVGICDSMSYEDIQATYPNEFEARKKDKLNYRYPEGESYMDLVARLEPVIFELERIRSPVLVICHRAVSRCLYSYFLNTPPESIPHVEIPLHTVLKLQPKAYGCTVEKFSTNVPSVESDTTKQLT